MAEAADEPEQLAPAAPAPEGGGRAVLVAALLAGAGAAVTFLSEGGVSLALGVVLLLAGVVAACAVLLPAAVE
jgi:hypothetical protein